VKEMMQRFEVQEKMKQEILERERQLKRIEAHQAETQELNNNIHKKYLRTKYKEKYGTSKWHRENSEEMTEKMYKRAFEKKEKFEKIEQQKAEKTEKDLKGLFRPKILKSVESWENLKRNEKKIESRIKKKEQNRIKQTQNAVSRQTQRFRDDNENTVFSRMQRDLEERRERERKRRQLKKFKDKHFKEYTEIMENGIPDHPQNPDTDACHQCEHHREAGSDQDLSEIIEKSERNESAFYHH